MNKLKMGTIILTSLATAALSLPASAGHRRQYDDRNDEGVVYAQVVSARPQYREVRVSEPRQECHDERVVYRDRERDNEPNTAGLILGGIIGGVAGHQIGGGHGRDVATALGAVIGAGVGANAGRGYGRGYGRNEHVNYEQHCQTYDDYRTESQLDGYDVTYRYNGRLYNTSLPYDPGRSIPVRVDVQPVR